MPPIACSDRRERLYALVKILVMSMLAAFSFATPTAAERLPVKTYTVADGLLRDAVHRIRPDSRGFLWFCTSEGIGRFDGSGITNFTVSDGLPDRLVNDFIETRNGKLYVATRKGLARLNPNGLAGSTDNPLFSVFVPENPKARSIQILYEDRSGRLWAGTSDGLFKLNEDGDKVTFEHFVLGDALQSSGGAIAQPGPNTLPVSSIIEDRRGIFWVGSFGGGLFRISPTEGLRRYTARDRLSDNKVTDLLEDKSGRIWMSLRSDEKGGVCRLDPENAENPVIDCFTKADGLGSNWVRDMIETSDGQIWLATVPGLCRWQDKSSGTVCKTFSSENNLCDDMLSIAEDKDGNLWTGSACGAKKIARYGFSTFDRSDGLDQDEVESIFESSARALFILTTPLKNRIISRFTGERFVSRKAGLPVDIGYHGWGWKHTVRQDSKGSWWIPTGEGLYRSPDGTDFENLSAVKLTREDPGHQYSDIFRLFEDSRGDVWIATHGTSGELFRWERASGKWINHSVEAGFTDFRVGTAFTEDKTGTVWIGATSDHNESALVRYKNGQFNRYTKANGAPSGWIQDLFCDSEGRLWLASDNEGLWRLDDVGSAKLEFFKYTTANGLMSNSTASVVDDQYGRIYVGTWRGIDRLTPETGRVEHFTTDDGLPANLVRSSYRDHNNKLWFATDKGVSTYAPEPRRDRNPPNLFITGLRIEGVPQSVSIMGESEIPALELSSSQRQIAIEFIGLGASLGEKLRYEYNFNNSNWTATDERILNFANLSAGEYSVAIRAVTSDGIYSLKPALISFRIAAPIWQRPWFLAASAGLLALVIYLIYRARLRRFVELEKVRVRIATDLHDDIGANLTRIALLSEVARQKTENGNGQMLSSIADIARESVASMNDIVWAIAPEHDSLTDLTRRMRRHAEEVFASREIDLSFNAASSRQDVILSLSVRRDLLLIFKEAVNNAAKHSECSRASVDFVYDHSFVTLRIEDDGIGFDTSEVFDGQGVRSLKRRADSMGGRISIDSTPGRGTTVEFELRLGKSAFA